jgi:hypothetical protein
MLASSFLGPVLPFMAGAGFGFVGGMVHRYNVDLSEAKCVLERFP